AGIRARPDRGPRPPSRPRAPSPLRAARPVPAPLLGREGAGFSREHPPPPGLIVAVPRDGALEAVLERRARAPAEQPLGLVDGAEMTVDLARPLVDEELQLGRLAEHLQDGVGDVPDGDVDAGRNVDRLPGDVLDR